LKEKQDKLTDVQAQIAQLQQTFDDSLEEKERLVKQQALTQARMARAGKLTSALSDEAVRWEQKIAIYNEQITNVIGDVLIAAACVAYYGAFTNIYREELVSTWNTACREDKILTSGDASLVTILGDDFETRQWNSQGLPRDVVSTENAIMVTKARRWPLMIDPQDQANRWIRNKEAENGLKVIKLTDGSFLRTLENAIRMGLPVLCEELEETLDPSLEPILLKQTYTAAGRLLIRLADSDVDYDKDFRFYMTTKMANPHYMPEVCIKVTIINFTVTRVGLEDQVLSDVVRLERPDLESQRNELILTINADKAQLKDIENQILKLLFNVEGNILDNQELVDTLNESKVTSGVISKRLVEAEKTNTSISVIREKYRPIAIRGSVLFFVVASLQEIDPMYMFSLQYFNSIFNKTISSAPQSDILVKRLNILLDHTTFAIYKNVARGLFERHKLLFSFIMCSDIMRHQCQLITTNEWFYFLRGAPTGMDKERPPKPSAKWLTQEDWDLLFDLEDTLSGFTGLCKDLTRTHIYCALGEIEIRLNLREYKGYSHPKPPPYKRKKKYVGLRIEEPDEEKEVKIEDGENPPVVMRSFEEDSDDNKEVIGHWEEKLTMFQKLILVKMFRAERVVPAIMDFVSANIGRQFIENPPVTFYSLYEDMNKVTPLVLVLSPGSDPMGAFIRFAREMDMQDNYQAISLGQGQGPVAEKLIENARANGGWVFLQNCHLAKSFMPRLEEVFKSLKEMKQSEIHDDFRLFLSSMPTAFFPVAILQGSVKVTNEPPKGLRSNLRGALSALTPTFFEDHHLGLPWRKMVFGICFFHAIIQERKKFGPLGWNISYPFTDSDRECAHLNLQLFCKQHTDDDDIEVIPWDALVYITGEITYGGRVTDAIDQRCLQTVLARFFSKITIDDSDYKYSQSGVYFAPDFNTLDQYLEYVGHLPIEDSPEIFGMHNNANLAFQKQETGELISTILEVQPRMSTGEGGKSADEIVLELAENILQKLKVYNLDIDKASPAMFQVDSKGRLNSLTTVLQQEVERFNKLLQVIINSLETLMKAIEGLVVMSEQMELIYKSFLNNQVPSLWSNAAYPSLKHLGGWVQDLQLRCEYIGRWIRHGVPHTFWLSGFFFPQGFLTGVLQNHARKYDYPIDRLAFHFIPTVYTRDQNDYQEELNKLEPGQVCAADRKLPKIKDGVYIHGLFTDCFRFDTRSQKMANEKDRVMNERMPILHMKPELDFTPPSNHYICPLYKTQARAGVLSTTGHSTNFVVNIHLATDEEPDFWISRGSACVTALSK